MAGSFSPFYDAASWENFQALVAALNERPGTAVLGAGASWPLPGWGGLYDRIGLAAGVRGLPIAPRRASLRLPVMFKTVKDSLGGDWLLTTIESELKPTNALPEIYELVRTTASIADVHTFNYDSNLRTAAGRESRNTYSYPFNTWGGRDSRFLYLHGSIESATTIQELVLCEDDYLTAYSESSNLVSLLRHLYKLVPILFLGTSLSDDQFLRALGDIVSRVQRQPSADGEFRLTNPRWYVMLPRISEEDFDYGNSLMDAYHIRTIWYESDAEGLDHSALLQALNMLKDRLGSQLGSIDQRPDTLLRAREATRLAATPDPTGPQQQLALTLLGDRLARKVFLETASSPKWLRPLAAAGFLVPEEPTAVGEGLQAKTWVAAQFLTKVAAEAPNEVAKYLRRIRTTNWLVPRGLAQIAERLPDPVFWGLEREMERWIKDAPAYDTALTMSVLGRLSDNPSTQPPPGLLKAIIDKIGDDRAGHGEALIVGTAATEALLIINAVTSVTLLMVQALERYAAAHWQRPSKDDSWVQKRSLEEASQFDRAPGLDWLLRTAFAVCETQHGSPEHTAAVRRALLGRWPLCQRFALVELSKSAVTRDSLQSEIASRLPKFMESWAVYHESALFVEAILNSQSETDRRLLAIVGNAAASFAKRRPQRSERWMKILSGDATDGDRFVFGPVEVYSPTPPLSVEDLRERSEGLTAQELLRLTRYPEDFGVPIGWHESKDQLWYVLAQLVEQDGRVDIVFAITPELLAADDGASAVIRVAPKLKLRPQATKRLVRWLATLAGSSNSRAAHAGFDALLELAGNGVSVPDIEPLVYRVIRQHGATVDQGLPRGSAWTEGEPPDLMMRQLNDLSGKAVQLLVEAFFRERSSDVSSVGAARYQWDVPTWIREFALGELSAFVECRVAFGEVFAYVVIRDPELASRAVGRLIEGSTPLLARQAFWAGYCWRLGPHRQSLELLAGPLRADIVRLSSFQNVRRDVRDQLVSHAAIGWVQTIAGYEGLPEFVVSHGDSYAVERFVWATGQVLRGADEEMLDRLPALLEELVSAERRLGGTQPGYSSWLWTLKGQRIQSSLIFTLERLFSALPGREVYPVLEFLKELANTQPEMALALARTFLTNNSEDPHLGWNAAEIYRLLVTLAEAVRNSPILPELAERLANAEVLSFAQAKALDGIA